MMKNLMLGKVPTPEMIRARRESAQLTQSQAAALCHVTWRAWQRWEAAADLETHRAMPAGLWELFVLKTSRATMAPSRVQRLVDQLTSAAMAPA